jgi:cyclophilin family peptidyl-prolyl cis-trans isomerase
MSKFLFLMGSSEVNPVRRGRSLLLCLSLFTGVLIQGAGNARAAAVTAIPDSVREQNKLSAFYQKYIDLDGFPVLGSSNVSDFAMLESAWVIRQMLTNRADILRALATNKARLVVMAHNEYTTDIPEQANMTPKVYWDRRARGLGGRIASCAEENMLAFPGDPYSTENILVHEFSHVIHGVALRALDPTFNRRLREAYQSATNAGKWKGTYAATNPGEYWAEAAQSWFDNNRQNDALHNHVDTRAELKEYDPAVAKLCEEVFGDIAWRYKKPLDREPAGRAHLAGYDASKAPRFRWRAPAVPERPRVSIETALGTIEVELDAKAAPLTVTNFLRYVQAGLYNDGQFHRTVTLTNQPTNSVKIQVIQASANPAKTNEFFSPIKLESTRDTGLKHRDGTISMARAEVDSAQDHFFICIGDQPELDFGGKRNPDGQGFAAFGKVVRGMDVVRKIHNARADGQSLQPPVRIQRALRSN